VIPGKTYLLTRRCFGRTFFLRPSPKINQIFKFCLAVAAARTGVQLHAYGALSNHYHVVATDPLGTLPQFMHWLNEYIAKCVNAELGRWESFWAPGSYSSVRLDDPEDVVDKLVYVYANPVDATLVRSLKEWPGARSLPSDIGGQEEIVSRPQGFFRENGPVPASAVLKLVPPPSCAELGPAFLPTLISRVAEREAELLEKARRKDRQFLGRRRVLAQSPFGRPKSVEPRRGLNPRVAGRDKWRRIASLRRLKGFLAAYRLAWARFSNGDWSVRFPYGTYWMRVHLGVLCDGP
jgi:hypothetical protein